MRGFTPGPAPFFDAVAFDPMSLGITVGGSIISGALASSAASDAADKQEAAGNRAAADTRAMFDTVRGDLAPFRGYGVTAGNKLVGDLDYLTKPFNPSMADLEATPGYQFTREQGLRAVQNAAAAKGLGISGAALRGAADYATGQGGTKLKTQFDIDQANKTNSFNKLLALTNSGEGAAATTGNLGVQSTQNANNFATSGAAASAAGDIGGANALSKAIGGIGSNAMNYALINRLQPQGGY